jgi:hypothetical protein
MNLTTKSPLWVARRALAAGRRALRSYAHRFSPKRFTQPQLFACLVLKAFFRTDYRGCAQFLHDMPVLRWTLGLRAVPHFTTLQKAARRLLALRRARRLLTATVRQGLGRRRVVPLAAFDATGFECGQISPYFLRRRNRSGKRTARYTRYAKLEAAVDCQRHLIIGALAGRGPRSDADRFVPLLDDCLRRVRPCVVLADAGFDSEPNYRYAREVRRIRSVIPAKLGRPGRQPPTGHYRRLMKRHLSKSYCRYGQRWQAETVFSMIKRRLGSAVGGRSYESQCRDLHLLVITHNVMLLN